MGNEIARTPKKNDKDDNKQRSSTKVKRFYRQN